MALKNTQYDEIMRDYYPQTRQKTAMSRRDASAEPQRLSRSLPPSIMRSLLLASLPREKPSKAMRQPSPTSGRISEALSEKKTELLTSHGYPADYLEMYYHCPDCQDTGYIGQEKCHCFRQAVIDLLLHPVQHPGHSGRGKISIIFPSVTIPIRR